MSKKILFISREPEQMDGVCYHRVGIPAARLNDQQDDFEVCLAAGAMELEFKPDLVIANRTLSLFSEDHNDKTLAYLREHNIPYIIDLDDYWNLGKDHVLNSYYKKFRFPEQIIKTVKSAAQVWATNEYLAEKVRRINPKVAIVPNAIDFKQPQFEHAVRMPSDTVRIGWAGSTTHLHDIKLLEQSMKRLHKDESLKGKYTIMLGGHHKADPIMHEFERILSCNGRASRKEYMRIPKANVYMYGRMYEHMHISLCPLLDNEFNRCKSFLKALESGAKGCAVIASNVHPYNDLLVHEETALLIDENERGWHKAIGRLVNDHDLRERLASNLHELVKTRYNIDVINQIRINEIKKLI